MAKLYYRQPGEDRPERKKRYLPVTLRYKLAFFILLGLNAAYSAIMMVGL